MPLPARIHELGLATRHAVAQATIGMGRQCPGVFKRFSITSALGSEIMFSKLGIGFVSANTRAMNPPSYGEAGVPATIAAMPRDTTEETVKLEESVPMLRSHP